MKDEELNVSDGLRMLSAALGLPGEKVRGRPPVEVAVLCLEAAKTLAERERSLAAEVEGLEGALKMERWRRAGAEVNHRRAEWEGASGWLEHAEVELRAREVLHRFAPLHQLGERRPVAEQIIEYVVWGRALPHDEEDA